MIGSTYYKFHGDVKVALTIYVWLQVFESKHQNKLNPINVNKLLVAVATYGVLIQNGYSAAGVRIGQKLTLVIKHTNKYLFDVHRRKLPIYSKAETSPHTMSASSESYVTNIIITVTIIIISFSLFMERDQVHCIVRYSHRSLDKLQIFRNKRQNKWYSWNVNVHPLVVCYVIYNTYTVNFVTSIR